MRPDKATRVVLAQALIPKVQYKREGKNHCTHTHRQTFRTASKRTRGNSRSLPLAISFHYLSAGCRRDEPPPHHSLAWGQSKGLVSGGSWMGGARGSLLGSWESFGAILSNNSSS